MKAIQKHNRARANRLSMQFNQRPITYNKVSALSVLRTMPIEMLRSYIDDLGSHIEMYGESNDRTLQLLEKAETVLRTWES